jgi:hypothetical protein
MDAANRHDLFSFMSQISMEMASEYQRIRARALEDPGTAGDQGEENWAALLRGWLPAGYQTVTKGRLISHDGRTSPQVDVLILKPSYPRKLLDKKLYLAAGVAAAFECKITLTAEHIKKLFKNCALIKSLFPPRYGSPYRELRSPIIYGLLAHSHSWKSEKSQPLSNIEKMLYTSDLEEVTHPRFGLDLLCVADLAAWTSLAMVFLGPANAPMDWERLAPHYGREGAATTSYIGHGHESPNQSHDFTPIGVLISYLIQKLAWEDVACRDLADYYRLANLSGSGSGFQRPWPASIYSDAIRNRVQAGMLSSGAAWDEWSMGIT